jgi:neutral ceramidase
MTQSCQIIGMNQAQAALGLFSNASTPISGPVMFRHQFINFENLTVSAAFSSTGQQSNTCFAALGDSFAAGTTDGPGFGNFVQGTNSTSTNPLWNALGNLLSEPTQWDKNCQAPKPILLNTGGIHIPEHAPWTASVLPLQMFRIGQLYIIGVPGEFTTMSGRRLRNQVRAVLMANGAADANTHIVIAGLSNEYIHYCATPEEYSMSLSLSLSRTIALQNDSHDLLV